MVNYNNVPRLFFAGGIGDTAPGVRYLIGEEKEEGFGEALWALIGVRGKTLISKTVCEV